MPASQDTKRMQERQQDKSKPHEEGKTGRGLGRFKISEAREG